MRSLPVVLLTLVALGATACGGDAAPEAETAVMADTALLSAETVRIGGFELAAAADEPWRDAWQLAARVTLDPASTQPLGSIVEGRVLEVRVFPGDRVRAGDVLVAVHSHEVMDARQELVAARAGATSADSAATAAESAAARAERLLAAKAISLGEVERTRAARTAALGARDAARAEYERAVAFLDHLVGSGTPPGTDEHAALLRAPFDGVVTGREVQPGQVVLVGQSLVSVARDAALGVLMRLPEEASADVAVGAPVRFTVPAFAGRTFDARVTRVAPVVDSMSRAIEVFARATGDAQRLLRAEMTADAELLGNGALKALSVPAMSVQVMEGDTVVIRATRLGEGMLLEAVPVRLGRRTSLRMEILEGIVAGDSVLAKGAAVGKSEILRRQSGGEGGHGH
jgi:cobalt-zinc-cadmium efflux system membrane fusion protein